MSERSEPSPALRRFAERRRRRIARWRRRMVALRGTGGLRTAAAVVAGAAVYLGFAPSTWWWAPIVGLSVLALALNGRSWRVGAGLGLVFGAALFLPMLSWSGIYVGKLPWFALALMEAVLVMPSAALIAIASRRLPLWPVWAACLWVGGEALRAVFPFGGFPWGGIAFTQPDGPLLPLAAAVGEPGLTLAVAVAGFALGELAARLWRGVSAGVSGRRSRVTRHDDASPTADLARPAIVAPARAWLLAALVALPFVAGLLAVPVVQTGAGAPTAPIAVIQGNVPEPGLEFNARRRAVLDMHVAETERLARAVDAGSVPRPVAVIWPENASDIDPYRNADAAAEITGAARAVGVPILVGAVVLAGQTGQHDGSGGTIGHVYNMGIVWDPVTGPGQTYTKRDPVPFAEYMPYRSFFRFFSDKVDLITADFLPGSRPGNLDVGGVAVGDVICFEIVRDSLVHDVVAGGAQVIVVQTNNATFGYTNETYQQQAMSRVRAVEYGREVLIAATSGVSAVIRPDGSVATSIGLFTAGFAVPQVPLIAAITPGTVLSEPVRWAATIAGPLALLGAALWRRRSRHSSLSDHAADDARPEG